MRKILCLAALLWGANLAAGDVEDGIEALHIPDYHQAHVHFEKACDENIAKGCIGMANLYEYGRDVEKNFEKAKELLKKACDLGDKKGCEFYEHADEKHMAEMAKESEAAVEGK